MDIGRRNLLVGAGAATAFIAARPALVRAESLMHLRETKADVILKASRLLRPWEDRASFSDRPEVRYTNSRIGKLVFRNCRVKVTQMTLASDLGRRRLAQQALQMMPDAVFCGFSNQWRDRIDHDLYFLSDHQLQDGSRLCEIALSQMGEEASSDFMANILPEYSTRRP